MPVVGLKINHKSPVFWRLIIAIGGTWRVLDLLDFAIWSHNNSPWSVSAPVNFWLRWHPILAPLSELFVVSSLIICSYFFWAFKGKYWGLLPLLLAPMLSSESIPLGWGLLSIQPFILLYLLSEIIPLKYHFAWRWLCLGQIVWMYAYSASSKDVSIWWIDPQAFRAALSGDFLPTLLGKYIYKLTPTNVLEILTRFFYLLQWSVIFLPFIVFFKGFGKGFNAWIFVMGSFHVFGMIFLSIEAFSLGCLGLLALPLIEIEAPIERTSSKILSSVFLSIWSLTICAGVWKSHSVLLWRLGFVQSWSVMKRPESPGYFIFQINHNQWSSEKLKSKKSYALAYALRTNQNIRKEWLSNSCSSQQRNLVYVMSHSSPEFMDQSVNYSCGD